MEEKLRDAGDRRLSRADGNGKLDRDDRAVGMVICERDFAAAFARDAVTDAEAESSSLADGLGGVKGIERAIRIAESWTGILELDGEIGRAHV